MDPEAEPDPVPAAPTAVAVLAVEPEAEANLESESLASLVRAALAECPIKDEDLHGCTRRSSSLPTELPNELNEAEANLESESFASLLMAALAECPFKEEDLLGGTYRSSSSFPTELPNEIDMATSAEEAEPESEHSVDEGESLAALFLVALAYCPFRQNDAREPVEVAADSEKSLQPRRPVEFSQPAWHGLDEAALSALRTGIALACRGKGKKALVKALSDTTYGLGGSVQALRGRAAAGDDTVKRVLNALDRVVPRGASSLSGAESAAARARRLSLALALPETCPRRQEAMQAAIDLCGAAARPQPGDEPEAESVCGDASIGLLMRARAEDSLQKALNMDSIEL